MNATGSHWIRSVLFDNVISSCISQIKVAGCIGLPLAGINARHLYPHSPAQVPKGELTLTIRKISILAAQITEWGILARGGFREEIEDLPVLYSRVFLTTVRAFSSWILRADWNEMNECCLIRSFWVLYWIDRQLIDNRFFDVRYDSGFFVKYEISGISVI